MLIPEDSAASVVGARDVDCKGKSNAEGRLEREGIVGNIAFDGEGWPLWMNEFFGVRFRGLRMLNDCCDAHPNALLTLDFCFTGDG